MQGVCGGVEKGVQKQMKETILAVLVGIPIVIVLVLLSAWPIQLLWNDLMPELFGLKTITFWQAFELDLLCTCLFYSGNGSSSSK